MKRSILVFTRSYFPGYKEGGPPRSLSGIVEALGDEYHFRIVTRDRDFTDRMAYKEIEVDRWQSVGKAEVLYATPEKINWKGLLQILRTTEHDVLYLNSVFDLVFGVLPLCLYHFRMRKGISVVVAPRGELSPEALRFKSIRKGLFLVFCKGLRLHRSVLWHASGEREERDIARVMKRATIRIAPDLSTIGLASKSSYDAVVGESRQPKVAGSVNLVFLSRISPMKNLESALASLMQVTGQVCLDVYGPIEDKSYWRTCQKLMMAMPSNVTVRYQGEVSYKHVLEVFEKHHFFLFPTRGESFGHVILESLIAGCPVIISDQTPWNGLEMLHVGWEVPLGKTERLSSIVQRCIDMGEAEHARMVHAAIALGKKRALDPAAVEMSRALFL